MKRFGILLIVVLAGALLICPQASAWQTKAKSSDTGDQQSKPSAQEEKSLQDKSEKKEKSKTDNADQSKDEVSEAKSATAEPPRTRSRRRSRENAIVRVSRSGSQFLSLFEPIVSKTIPATVEVKKGDDTLAMGAIVDADGFVLTKLSELRRPLSVEMSDGRSFSAYVYGVHEPTDLALLKIDAKRLPTIRWSNIQSPEIGTWLATVSVEERPIAVGVVGVMARRIKPPRGFMGVNLEVAKGKVRISIVTPKTPAERAGVKVGDVVLQINETSVSTIPKLQEIVGDFPPGQTIRMTVQRDGKKVVLDITLGNAEELNPLFERNNQQNSMGSTLSQRRSDFPLAVQHDSPLQSSECGGPVVDVDGKVIGINIARKGRVSSLMLPASLVTTVLEELKSGQLAPALVNKRRIEEINMRLREIQATLELSPLDNDELQQNLKDLVAEEKKAKKKLDEAMAELDKAKKDKHKTEFELEHSTKKLQQAKREKERLEREREKLVTGSR